MVTSVPLQFSKCFPCKLLSKYPSPYSCRMIQQYLYEAVKRVIRRCETLVKPWLLLQKISAFLWPTCFPSSSLMQLIHNVCLRIPRYFSASALDVTIRCTFTFPKWHCMFAKLFAKLFSQVTCIGKKLQWLRHLKLCDRRLYKRSEVLLQ
jgi:hypothetical protein